MTNPPPPGFTVDPYAPVAWVEPTRRLPFSPRFTYDGRYGAALVSVVLGGYLLLTANVSQLALALGGVGAYPAEQVVLFLTQYLFAVAVLVFGLAVAPATSGRRIIAIVVVLVLLLIWTMMVAARVTGAAGPLPFASGFVVATSFIVPLVTATGWLIVRERPGISYLLLLLTLIGGALPLFFTLNALPSTFTYLVAMPLAAVLGAGIAWGARAIAAGTQRMHSHDDLVDPPVGS
jgi:hypothetical protein